MIKKFIKRTGRALKKLGKEIGKPFKSMMKTKIGKIIGTIGMMMIGGWMMAGAKTFASTLWAGQGVGTAFSQGISAMGNAASTSFKTITGGIQDMFTKGGTQPAGTGAENLKTDILNNPEVKVDTKTLSESSKEIVKQTTGAEDEEPRPKYFQVGVRNENYWTTGELLAMAQDCEKTFSDKSMGINYTFHGEDTLAASLWEIAQEKDSLISFGDVFND